MKNKFAVVAALCGMFVLISATEEVISSCRAALSICAELILPSLLPFFILSILLNRLGLPFYLGKFLSAPARKILNISGAGASAFFIGITGGYPLGAAYIADMTEKKYISCTEGERLLAFCNNSGPAFIIGAIGSGVFHSQRAGILLYTVHIAAALLSGAFFFRGRDCSTGLEIPEKMPFSKAFPEAIMQSVSSVLNVCGFVVCFTVFVGLLDANGFFTLLSGHVSDIFNSQLHWSRALLTGILEIGSAAGAMQGLLPSPKNLSLAAAILGWGGISVHFQTYALISNTNLKGTLHFAGRLSSAAISAILAYCAAYFV